MDYHYINKTGLVPVPDYIKQKNGTYLSYNPKSYDVRRAIRVPLDKPSQVGSIPLCNLYTNKQLRHYTPYDMNKGQIQYYIDDSIKDAYYKPIYDIPFSTMAYMYTDPMTSEKPHYVLVNSNEDVDDYSVLSSISDSTFHRENLIASQQAKRNQERITPFF